MNQEQQVEVDKYELMYRKASYRMGDARKERMLMDLDSIEPGTLLDVGCGRGEVVREAEARGFEAKGVEVVEDLIDNEKVFYGMATNLPFTNDAFDVVTMYDVMEHLLPMDALPACLELQRVARKTIFLAISSRTAVNNGIVLHIHVKPEKWWHEFLATVFDGIVTKVNASHISTTWRIDLGGTDGK